MKAVDPTTVRRYNNRDFDLHHAVYRSHLASHLGYKQKAAIALSNEVWKNFATYLHTRSESFKQWLGSVGAQVQALGMGTPPFVFANRVFGTHGVDASKDITWMLYPAGELGLALKKGEVDAMADSEPIGTLLIAQGIARNVEGMDEAQDLPYATEYCCEIIANGKWIDANPDSAARATRAILRAAKWVQENPKAAAALAVPLSE